MTWRPLVTFRWSHRPRLPFRTTKIRLDSCPRYRRHCVPPKCSSHWACFQVPANYFGIFRDISRFFELLSAYLGAVHMCANVCVCVCLFSPLFACSSSPFVWALFVWFPFFFCCQSFCVAFCAHYKSYCCTFCMKFLIWFSLLFCCAISNWLQL